MLETSFTSLKTAQPQTQNGNFEFPQDISLFLSGAWTSNVGSFLQVTYDTQDDHFTSDNTDIRFANKTKLGGKELVTASISTTIPPSRIFGTVRQRGVTRGSQATTLLLPTPVLSSTEVWPKT